MLTRFDGWLGRCTSGQRFLVGMGFGGAAVFILYAVLWLIP